MSWIFPSHYREGGADKPREHILFRAIDYIPTLLFLVDSGKGGMSIYNLALNPNWYI